MGLFASFIGCKVDRLDFLGGIPLKFEIYHAGVNKGYRKKKDHSCIIYG